MLTRLFLCTAVAVCTNQVLAQNSDWGAAMAATPMASPGAVHDLANPTTLTAKQPILLATHGTSIVANRQSRSTTSAHLGPQPKKTRSSTSAAARRAAAKVTPLRSPNLSRRLTGLPGPQPGVTSRRPTQAANSFALATRTDRKSVV